MDMNLILLAICTYGAILVFGSILHKYLRMPWMFTVVILGIILSTFGLFRDSMQGNTFLFLSKAGMLLFLFTIGIDLDLEKIRLLGKYIIIGDILLTLTEGLLLGLFFYFVYPDFVNHSFFIAFIAGMGFGTVGEVILLSILKEFGLENTRFGQLMLGIGVFDDIFEISVLALIIAAPSVMDGGANTTSLTYIVQILIIFAGIIATTLLSNFAGKRLHHFFEAMDSNSFIFPFMIFLIFFSFIFFSSRNIENMNVVAAIFAGIAIKKFLPEKIVSLYKKPIFFLGNIFLGPFFFLSLGSKISFQFLVEYPILVLSIVLISLTVRVLLSILLFRNLFGVRLAAVMGVGLCAKFSTSVVSENLMMTSGLISVPLYSAIMAAFILMKPIIIGVFSSALATFKDTGNT